MCGLFCVVAMEYLNSRKCFTHKKTFDFQQIGPQPILLMKHNLISNSEEQNLPEIDLPSSGPANYIEQNTKSYTRKSNEVQVVGKVKRSSSYDNPGLVLVSKETQSISWRQGFTAMPAAEAADAAADDGDHDSSYSPITMSSYWPKIGRLLFVLTLSVFGSVLNGFFLSSFCVNYRIRRIGNVFLACAAIADMVITAAVMPVVTVILLSGEWETLYVCKTLQFLTQTSSYAFSLNFAFVGAENYFRLCRDSQEYELFLSMGVEMIAALFFVLSIIISGAGVFMDLDYDYCKREHMGNYHFKLVTSIFFTILPSLMVYGFLIITIFILRNKIRLESRFRQSRAYGRECSMLASNLIAYSLYIMAWIPYFIIVNKYPYTSDSNYYNTAWTGVLRSVVFGFSYGIVDRNFRQTYSLLFDYCCCKINITNPFAGRRRNRAFANTIAVPQVRVHIMHRALGSNNPHRGTVNIQETQSL